MSLFTVIPYGKNVGGNSSATAGSNSQLTSPASERTYHINPSVTLWSIFLVVCVVFQEVILRVVAQMAITFNSKSV
jgi:hypothetical protein